MTYALPTTLHLSAILFEVRTNATGGAFFLTWEENVIYLFLQYILYVSLSSNFCAPAKCAINKS